MSLLTAAVIDHCAGRITMAQLLEVFQDAIDSGAILEPGNEFIVLMCVLPLLESGELRPSQHSDAFKGTLDVRAAGIWLRAREP